MLKTYILSILLLFSLSVFAQTFCKINKISPKWFQVKSAYFKNGKLDSLEFYLQQLSIEDSNKLLVNYQFACFYAQKYDTILFEKYINNAIQFGASAEDIFTEPDFELINKTLIWKKVEKVLELNYLNNQNGISKPDLSIKLWKIGIEDQRFRTLYKKNVKISNEYKRKYKKLLRKNQRFVFSLIRGNYWPTFNEIGQQASESIFLILQHSRIKHIHKKALQILSDLISINQASKIEYAMLLDRYLMESGERQRYGTQIVSFNLDGVMSDDILYPLENYKNINKMREELGLNSIEEYCKEMNVIFRIPSEEEIKSIMKIMK